LTKNTNTELFDTHIHRQDTVIQTSRQFATEINNRVVYKNFWQSWMNCWQLQYLVRF